MKKAIVSLMAMVTIGNVLIPSTVSVKAAEVSSISTNENLFSPKKINETLENFKNFLANKGLTIEEAKQLNSSEKEEIIQEYIDYSSCWYQCDIRCHYCCNDNRYWIIQCWPLCCQTIRY